MDDFRSDLESIMQEGALHKLGLFQNEELRKSLSLNDQELLATLEIMRGEELLRQEAYQEAVTWFEKALQLCPNHCDLLQRVGYQLFASAHPALLRLAEQKLQMALALDPNHVGSLVLLPSVIAHRAYEARDLSLFEEANRCFVQVEPLLLRKADKEIASFYWAHAEALFLQGQTSGEAVDYGASLEKFRQAEECGICETAFWLEYGHALFCCAELLTSQEHYLQARNCYNLVVQEDPFSFSGWYYLGVVHHALFDLLGREEDYIQAFASYEEASVFDEKHLELLVRFGTLLVSYGRVEHDPETIEASIEKFALAHEHHEDHPAVYNGWGEALMLLGMYREELSLLIEAKDKVLKGLELAPEQAAIWGCYGACLYELGRYFQDESYHRSAIEQFRHGLSLDSAQPFLWLGLARAHFAIADHKQDVEEAKEALHAAEKAFSLRKNLSLFCTNYAICLLQMAELSMDRQYIELAVERLQMAIELFDKDKEHYLYVETLYHYGYALDFLGDLDCDAALYQKAVGIFSLVLEKESGYAQARAALASCLLHLGELTDDVAVLQESCEHFKLLAEEDVEDAAIFCEWAIALLNLAFLTKDTGRPGQEEHYLVEAEEKLQQSNALGGTLANYFLACLFALKGQKDAAMHFIEKAEYCRQLPPLDELLEDEWLTTLHDDPTFQEFIQRLKMRNVSDP